MSSSHDCHCKDCLHLGTCLEFVCWRRSTRETRSPSSVWSTLDPGRLRVPFSAETESGSHKTVAAYPRPQRLVAFAFLSSSRVWWIWFVYHDNFFHSVVHGRPTTKQTDTSHSLSFSSCTCAGTSTTILEARSPNCYSGKTRSDYL